MLTLLHNYIRIHNIIELSSYLISLLYILDAFTWKGQRIEIVDNGRYGKIYLVTKNARHFKGYCSMNIPGE